MHILRDGILVMFVLVLIDLNLRPNLKKYYFNHLINLIMKKLIKIEQFGNTILRWYSDGSMYQIFCDGTVWRLI